MGKLLTVRMSDEDRERWGAAAQRAGLSLSAWVRQVLDMAASPVVVELRPMSAEDEAELKRLAEEASKTQQRIMPLSAPRKDVAALCPRCARVGTPACSECRKAFGLS